MAHYIGETAYKGEEKLVISLDVGTTHTAVSYVYLYPGEQPQVKMVTKWPGQPGASGDSKIPTIIAYQKGEAKAFGVEATEFVGDEEYEIAKWFKLYLHPDDMKQSNSDHPPAYGSASNVSKMEIPPLPTGVTLKMVYSDLLRYIHQHTRDFFEKSTPNGPAIWDRVQDQLVVVMAVPNGWDTSQHVFLRTSTIESGWATKKNVDRRLIFVSEGEASVHYALEHQSSSWLADGMQFVIIDGGGSTVDSTLYECKAMSPKLVLEEVCASECVQAGGVSVDRAAWSMLQEKLSASRYGSDDFLTEMINEYEQKTKRLFNGSQTNNVIHFGRNTDNDRSHSILKGKLSLTDNEVASTFNDAISRIQDSCLKLLRGRKVKYIILVGGFGESGYLHNQLKEAFSEQGIQIVTVDEPSKKAAASVHHYAEADLQANFLREGATLWYVRKFVTARAARSTFGTRVVVHYKPHNSSHAARAHRLFTFADGTPSLPGAFSVLIKKDTVIKESHISTIIYVSKQKIRPTSVDNFSVDIFTWSGDGCPEWIGDEKGIILTQMRRLCSLGIESPHFWSAFQKETNIHGEDFWRMEYKIDIEFGGTQLAARVVWHDGKQLIKEPATIFPNSTAEILPDVVIEGN